MKWIKRGMGTVVLLAIFFVGVGFVLPSGFKVERSIEIDAPADKVYGLIADPRAWKQWAIWNQRDPAMQVVYDGAPSGKGARWTWQSKSEGSGSMEFNEAIANAGVTYRLSFQDFGMESKGQIGISPKATGVRVTWTNEGEMGINPLKRWFGVFMDQLVGPDFDAGLANLKRLAEGR